MIKTSVDFHANTKTTLLITTMCFLSLFFVSLLAIFSTNNEVAQLLTLLKSKYNYSAIINDTEDNDSYIQVDAGVTFAISGKPLRSINAMVLMQKPNIEYTDLVNWNANELCPFGVAITDGIARKYGLKIGDNLYSKHVVSGEMCEYSIEEILPDIVAARVEEKAMFGSGLIIMGYDCLYSENLSCNVLLFSNKPIAELSDNQSNFPKDIIYREDEVSSVIRAVVPYLLLYILLSTVILVLFVLYISKSIECNYRRLILLGFDNNKLKRSYNRYIIVIGGVLILFVNIVASVIACGTGLFKCGILWISMLLIVELISLYISLVGFRKRYWG